MLLRAVPAGKGFRILTEAVLDPDRKKKIREILDLFNLIHGLIISLHKGV